MGIPTVCQPSQTCLSRAGSRLSDRISVIFSMSRHSLAFAPFGQYFPLPYAPSIDATMRVNSSASFGSGGADIVSEFLRTSNCLRSAGGRATLSNRRASFAYFVTAFTNCSLACAARISVSWVMKVDCTQPARLPLVTRRSMSALTSARNFRASAAVAGRASVGVDWAERIAEPAMTVATDRAERYLRMGHGTLESLITDH